jgi:polysaccharide export outer membrane protein
MRVVIGALAVICAAAMPLAAQEKTAVAAATAPAGSAIAGPTISAKNAPPDYVIGIGDVLEVLFWREKELSAEVSVRPDGKITLPLLNEIEANGLTPEQLRLTVLERANRFVDDPRPTVLVKEINSRNVYIIGQVTKQGTYPLLGPTSVLQLIAIAGGITDLASGDSAFILRNGNGRQMRIRFKYKSALKGERLEQNIDLKAGDTVVVP